MTDKQGPEGFTKIKGQREGNASPHIPFTGAPMAGKTRFGNKQWRHIAKNLSFGTINKLAPLLLSLFKLLQPLLFPRLGLIFRTDWVQAGQM